MILDRLLVAAGIAVLMSGLLLGRSYALRREAATREECARLCAERRIVDCIEGARLYAICASAEGPPVLHVGPSP